MIELTLVVFADAEADDDLEELIADELPLGVGVPLDVHAAGLRRDELEVHVRLLQCDVVHQALAVEDSVTEYVRTN